MFAGFVGHGYSPEAKKHVHGYTYSHGVLDMHNAIGGDHKHDTENTEPQNSVLSNAQRANIIGAVLSLVLFLMYAFLRKNVYVENEATTRVADIHTYEPFVFLYTRLFSDGILNPKLF